MSQLPTFTKQETFEFVINHLLTQMGRCCDQWGEGLYRDHHGKTSAIGCLIPKDRYKPCIEGKPPSLVFAVLGEGCFGEHQCDESLFDALEDLHDNYGNHSVENGFFMRSISRLANKHSLSLDFL